MMRLRFLGVSRGDTGLTRMTSERRLLAVVRLQERTAGIQWRRVGSLAGSAVAEVHAKAS